MSAAPRRRRAKAPGTRVTLEEGQHLIAASESEETFLQFTRDTALANGWLFYHTRRSDRSDKGFYDVVAIHTRQKRMVLAELKSLKGRTSDEQKVWAAAARSLAAAWAEAMVYRDQKAPLATVVYPPSPSPMYPAPRPETWPLAYYAWRPTKSDKDEILKVFKWQR